MKTETLYNKKADEYLFHKNTQLFITFMNSTLLLNDFTVNNQLLSAGRIEE